MLVNDACKHDNCQKECRINATTSHVEGHLDSENEVNTLATPEKTNVKADSPATKHHDNGNPSLLQA